MKRHGFDPTSIVLGLAFAALGLFFLLGDRTAADIGWEWIWPVPVVLLGLLFVISATRRVIAQREVVPESDDEELAPPGEVGP
jgi:cytochrome c-type biogenesis protein CcmH/NrfF